MDVKDEDSGGRVENRDVRRRVPMGSERCPLPTPMVPRRPGLRQAEGRGMRRQTGRTSQHAATGRGLGALRCLGGFRFFTTQGSGFA